MVIERLIRATAVTDQLPLRIIIGPVIRMGTKNTMNKGTIGFRTVILEIPELKNFHGLVTQTEVAMVVVGVPGIMVGDYCGSCTFIICC